MWYLNVFNSYTYALKKNIEKAYLLSTFIIEGKVLRNSVLAFLETRIHEPNWRFFFHKRVKALGSRLHQISLKIY